MVNKWVFIVISMLLLSCGNNVKTQQHEKFELISTTGKLPLIPYPQFVDKRESYFELNATTALIFDASLVNEGNYLKQLIENSSAFSLSANSDSSSTAIHLKLTPIIADTLTNVEAYHLAIDSNSVVITGCSPAGVMRGVQSLRQLFVNAFHQQEKRENWFLPQLEITDFPAFQHRGFLLDVCRHFFEKDVVLKYIDALAYYKMNVLHLHLTEDQGWRIPIEKYPKLTSVSAFRLDSNGNKYGGFYTKKELKEIVAYAAQRHITVIPEIELPGHSQAAIAAYPHLSCTGKPVEVVNDWGVFKEIYCAGNDSTFIFLEDVLTEVMEIFPSEYIHIGGDEAPKFRWETCEKCQNRMKDEALADEHELQRYFIERIEAFLTENGRKLIGWDEILEGGLSPTATVQSWRGFEGGIKAASTQHNVIMSPTSHCYLDYGLKSIDLEKIYGFDPIPGELDEKYHQFIIGAEGNMWTEHVPTEKSLDSKVFPRLIGLSEVLWTYNKNRSFIEFYDRLQYHYPTLKAFNIQYGLETIGATITQNFTPTEIELIVKANLPNLDVLYGWDNDSLREYTAPIPFDKSGDLNVQATKNNEPYGEPILQQFRQHKGVLAKAVYGTSYNKWYTANDTLALVDGKLGSLDFRDGNWQGFWGNDAYIKLDLGKLKLVEAVELRFYQYANSWIFVPPNVNVFWSTDNKKWSDLRYASTDSVDVSNKKSIKTIKIELPNPQEVRYLRIEALNLGKVPLAHEAAGSPAWIFMDEIIVK